MSLLPHEEARRQILAEISPLETEMLPLGASYSRILAEDVAAQDRVPPWDNSAMDGFAIRWEDAREASPENPVTLTIVAEIQAGAGDLPRIGRGQAATIMTGAPLPPGGDTVVPHEETSFTEREVTLSKPVREEANIRRAGEDMSPGDIVLQAGTPIRAAEMGIAAAAGCAELLVRRRPRAVILSTGDEVVPVGAPLGPGKIRNANAYSLTGLVLGLGGEPIDGGIVPDEPEAVRRALDDAIAGGADLIITTGGVSAGERDFIKRVAVDMESTVRVWRLAIKPGKPLVYGKIRGVPLFGLPGNPVSCIISFEVFVSPAMKKMLGRRDLFHRTVDAHFTADVRVKTDRVLLLRARLEYRNGRYEVEPPGPQGSAMLAGMARVNAIIPVPMGRTRIEAGDVLEAFLIGEGS